jgi:tripartite-type tricarboxylate transporter receptor subunit TctC
MFSRRGWLAFFVVATAALVPSLAVAEFPDKPIRLVVPQAPGSATDTVARILAAELGQQLGQTIIVENRPGGALTIGIDIVAKSPPDGYTLGMGPIGALAITRHMVARLAADRAGDARPFAAGGVAEVRIPYGQGTGGRSQEKSRQAHQRLVEQRLAGPCRGRAVQVHDRH